MKKQPGHDEGKQYTGFARGAEGFSPAGAVQYLFDHIRNSKSSLCGVWMFRLPAAGSDSDDEGTTINEIDAKQNLSAAARRCADTNAPGSATDRFVKFIDSVNPTMTMSC